MEENYFRNCLVLLVSRKRERMKVISQKKFSINNGYVETSDHATLTIIIEIKTLDLFQATKRQQAYFEGREGKCCLETEVVWICWFISGNLFAEERFFDTQFHNRGTSAGI
jgi:hypothetical protein